MLWYNTLQKQKVCYLIQDKNSKFAHLNLISISKLITLSKVMSTDILALLLMTSSTGSHTLHMYAGQCQKKYSYYLSSNTSRRKLFYHAHISSHLTYASTVWECCSDILFRKLNSLHRRAAKLMLPDPSIITEAKIHRLGLLPLREKLMLNKAVLVFKACRNHSPQYLASLFVCSNNRSSSKTIILPKPRIYFFKTSFSFSCASI